MHTKDPENARRRNIRLWLETVNWDNGLLVGHRNGDDVQRNACTIDTDLRGIGLAVTERFMHEDTSGQDMLIPSLDGQENLPQPQAQQQQPPLSPWLLQQPPGPELHPATVLSLAPDGGNNVALDDQAEAISAGIQEEVPTPGQQTPTGGTEDTSAFTLAGMGAQFDAEEGTSEKPGVCI